VRCSHVVAIHLLVELGAELDVGDKDGLHPYRPSPSLPPSLPAAPSLPVVGRHGVGGGGGGWKGACRMADWRVLLLCCRALSRGCRRSVTSRCSS
jgi:hypothetical protein